MSPSHKEPIHSLHQGIQLACSLTGTKVMSNIYDHMQRIWTANIKSSFTAAAAKQPPHLNLLSFVRYRLLLYLLPALTHVERPVWRSKVADDDNIIFLGLAIFIFFRAPPLKGFVNK